MNSDDEDSDSNSIISSDNDSDSDYTVSSDSDSDNDSFNSNIPLIRYLLRIK